MSNKKHVCFYLLYHPWNVVNVIFNTLYTAYSVYTSLIFHWVPQFYFGFKRVPWDRKVWEALLYSNVIQMKAHDTMLCSLALTCVCRPIYCSKLCIMKGWVEKDIPQNVRKATGSYRTYSPLEELQPGFKPDRADGFFQSVKIPSMTSFGRKVKPWVPYRRFTVCKRTSSRN